MNIWVDKQLVSVEQSRLTLQQLADYLMLKTDGIALVVNDEIIPRANWCETTLAEGDSISLFTVIAGG